MLKGRELAERVNPFASCFGVCWWRKEGGMRFSANVSILFKEVPFLDRFRRAAEAGFSAVEFWWPSDEDVDAVEKAVEDAGGGGALFTFAAGGRRAGDGGGRGR